MGYDVHYRVIDGGRFVPQHRERILIAGFDPAGTGVAAAPFSFDEIEYPPQRPVLASILHPQNGAEPADKSTHPVQRRKSVRNTRFRILCGNIFRRTPQNTGQRETDSVMGWSRRTMWQERFRRDITKTAARS